jgi:hypothetical protein
MDHVDVFERKRLKQPNQLLQLAIQSIENTATSLRQTDHIHSIYAKDPFLERLQNHRHIYFRKSNIASQNHVDNAIENSNYPNEGRCHINDVYNISLHHKCNTVHVVLWFIQGLLGGIGTENLFVTVNHNHPYNEGSNLKAYASSNVLFYCSVAVMTGRILLFDRVFYRPRSERALQDKKMTDTLSSANIVVSALTLIICVQTEGAAMRFSDTHTAHSIAFDDTKVEMLKLLIIVRSIFFLLGWIITCLSIYKQLSVTYFVAINR